MNFFYHKVREETKKLSPEIEKVFKTIKERSGDFRSNVETPKVEVEIIKQGMNWIILLKFAKRFKRFSLLLMYTVSCQHRSGGWKEAFSWRGSSQWNSFKIHYMSHGWLVRRRMARVKSRWKHKEEKNEYIWKENMVKLFSSFFFQPFFFFGISPTTLVVKRRDKVALTPFVCAPTARPPKADYVNEKEEMMAFRKKWWTGK